MSLPGKAAPKRIIICCDGTWQSAVTGERTCPSNITRLARCFNRVGVDSSGKEWQQIVWYDSGIGTTSGYLGKAFEGFSGAGLEGNVIEAYNFIVLNYSEGDEIMCFDFSRGAYTARSIAGLVSDIGICAPSKMQDFYSIWETYKKSKPGKRFAGSEAYFDYIDGKIAEKQPKVGAAWDQPARGEWASVDSRIVQVVGVFDTVGSLGMPHLRGMSLPFGPDKQGYHNTRLNRNIKHAFHAIALDEHREAFSPTLWHLAEWDTTTDEEVSKRREQAKQAQQDWLRVRFDREKTTKIERDAIKAAYGRARMDLFHSEENRKQTSELLQVWFPGVHINVGGGSDGALKGLGDLEELSSITLAWMLDQIQPYVSVSFDIFDQDCHARKVYIDTYNEQVRISKQKQKEESDAVAHESWLEWSRRSASAAVRSLVHPLTKAEISDLKHRVYGWGTGTIIDSYSALYTMNGTKRRTPGAYDRPPGKDDDKQQSIPNSNTRYTPTGLPESKFFRREKISGGKGWEYVIGGAILPEYQLPLGDGRTSQRFERRVLRETDAELYVSDLDQAWTLIGA